MDKVFLDGVEDVLSTMARTENGHGSIGWALEVLARAVLALELKREPVLNLGVEPPRKQPSESETSFKERCATWAGHQQGIVTERTRICGLLRDALQITDRGQTVEQLVETVESSRVSVATLSAELEEARRNSRQALEQLKATLKTLAGAQ